MTKIQALRAHECFGVRQAYLKVLKDEGVTTYQAALSRKQASSNETTWQVSCLPEEAAISEDSFCDELGLDETKMVIFTSGTTGQPKGVESSFKVLQGPPSTTQRPAAQIYAAYVVVWCFQAYDCNTATFESFLQLEDASTPAIFVVINPMHHTNSSAITDWALRRPGCHLHLCLRSAFRALLCSCGFMCTFSLTGTALCTGICWSRSPPMPAK